MIEQNSPIHWHEILRITNNKPELAKEMVAMLCDELPDMQKTINQTFKNQHYAALLETVHKLHGSCCYCGVPDLKKLTATIESKLKEYEYEGLEALIEQLNQEIKIILEYFNKQTLHETK